MAKRLNSVFKFKGCLAASLAMILLGNFNLYGATTAPATLTYTIGSINAITVSGNPGTLTINSAVAGSAPTNAVDATTTYAVTTNNTAIKVTAALSSNMPSGVTLTASLVAPTGATSAGAVSLSTTSQSLVTGIANIAQSGLSITYTLSATVSAAQVTNATNTVTYTIGP